MPSSGPGTSSSEAQRQPASDATRGSSSIVTMVSRKPRQVCRVSAVPTYSTGEYSLTSAENCAESATTAKPQTITSAKNHTGAAPKTDGGQRRAGRARPHRPDRDARAAEAIGEPAGERAAGGAAADGEKRGERSGGVGRRGAGRGEAGGGEHGNPGPHRVELPHVAEVAERREPRARGCRKICPIARGSNRRGGGHEWSVAYHRDDEHAAGDRQRRREQHRLAPRVPVERGQQVWKRLAERQRADQDPEREAALARETSRRRSSSPADTRTRAPRR